MKKIFYGVTVLLLTILMLPIGVDASTTADANWNNITTLMKNNQYLAELYKDVDMTVSSDSTKLEIIIDYDFQNPSVITYYRYNDMVTLNSANTTNNVLFALDEAIINREFISAVAETYGYDDIELNVWIEDIDSSKLNYANDGIEFIPYTVTSDDSYSTTTFKNLKINIDCGISAFEESDNVIPEEPETPVVPEEPEIPVVPEEPETPVAPEEPETPVVPEEPEAPVVPEEPKVDVETPVENPNTGLYLSLGVVSFALVSLLMFIISKKKNYFSKI